MNAIDPLVWSLLLIFLGCGLVVLEIFIPSGGILGFLSATAFITGIVLAFYYHGARVGVTLLGVTVLLLPVIVSLAFKYWPHTPMGRRFLLSVPSSEDVLPLDAKEIARKQLVGKIGVAKSTMLPSGAISIEGRTIDAVSQGMAIDRGQRVVIVEVRGNRIVVRPAEQDEQPERAESDDVLTQSLDALGIEPLDDPLG